MVVGGEIDGDLSLGVFCDNEIEMAREAEDSCPVSVITVTECATTVEVSVTLPENQVEFVDELIKKEIFQNRSQAIEEAVNLLEKQNRAKN